MPATLVFLLLFAVGVDCIAQADLPPRYFIHPDRIRYDSQCLTIDGQDVFIYSGSFHYFRCPKELWRDRFRRIKEAGFNTVETYVPWNWHEQQKPAGLDDSSKLDLRDLEDWLSLAEEFGFYVIVRPGPYICAEWDSGGFPQWLILEKPSQPARAGNTWLRSDDPAYLAWCKHWFDAVCPVIARHQVTGKPSGSPGVILVQLENEQDYTGFATSVVRREIKTLVDVTRHNGIEVPLFTCWTHAVRGQPDPLLRQIFDACNFYPRWNVTDIQKDIQKCRRDQPDAPLAVAELQGGWYSQVGGQLSGEQDGLTPAQINNLALFAIQNGVTILNFYMLCGGSNPAGWEARGMTSSYDYDAPIHECGGLDERYLRVQAVGQMLSEHGTRLARSTPILCQAKVSDSDVTVAERGAPDGSRYIFVRTAQHEASRKGTARVREYDDGAAANELVFDYELEPFGAAVLYLPPGVNDASQGQWLLKRSAPVERAGTMPVPVVLTDAVKCVDDGNASHWRPASGSNLIQLGIYDSGYVLYRAKVICAMATNLIVDFPEGDEVSAGVNGNLVAVAFNAPGVSAFPLLPGTNDVRLLYENHGHANSGPAMERPAGILGARLSGGLQNNLRPIEGWRMRNVSNVRKRPEIEADFDDENWSVVAVANTNADNLRSHHKAVYRAALELNAGDLAGRKKILTFGRIDDLGWIFVNGKRVGETADWSRAYSFDVTGELHPGRNSIAVIVQNNDGIGGLGAPGLADEPDGAKVTLEAIAKPLGVEVQYWTADFDDRSWAAAPLPERPDKSESQHLLAWYRMNFKLPSVERGVWAPWRLRLEAGGNGFLYLNGHSLGRFWQAGPQREFFLPECWLNSGSDRTNVLALEFHPGSAGAGIHSAIIEPYVEFAEKR